MQHMSVVVYRMKQIHKISLKYVPNDWSSPPRTAKTANNGLAVNVRLTVGLNRSKSKIIPMDLVAPVIVASRPHRRVLPPPPPLRVTQMSIDHSTCHSIANPQGRPWRIRPLSNTWFLGSLQVHTPNDRFIRLCSAQDRDQQTE